MPTRYQTTVERGHGAEITAVVGAGELERLAVPNGVDTALHLAVIWVEIALLLFAAAAIGALPFPLTVLCAVVLIVLLGTRINALNVVMHEASHGFLCKDRTRNDRVCNATASWWMLATRPRPGGCCTRSRSTGPPTACTTAT
jgi:fatty acid desaturase